MLNQIGFLAIAVLYYLSLIWPALLPKKKQMVIVE
ncbi:hypothetical protein N288_12125 [Bacillus infantis NRRL B-14911]|uniref:Uncharacterized protein n=1 Tax=Bacillus infantis NRRL B-14911 TaxID=1367477 RepID=U5LCA8_9BACI|nr:hypothetical protein N288_12125 [Bacillus infantis NRRL B-14911]